MIKKGITRVLHSFGYELRSLKPPSPNRPSAPTPPSVNPVWPLPRRPGGPSDEEIRNAFANHKLWHYAYEFDGGLSFSARYDESTDARPDARRRPLQRFRHFMPYLLEAQNGSLQGKRVLDIACNTGFWSIQCALLGAKVVGFDARDELVEQANLIKAIVGADNVEFKVLDFWDMSPQALGGTFDVVLNLGILYHLPNPIEALQLTKSLARDVILLDTEVYRSNEALVKYRWEEPVDIRMADRSGVIAVPSKSSIELILKDIGASAWFEIPVRTADMPNDYLIHRRASWLIKV